jgi:hypothetical protein
MKPDPQGIQVAFVESQEAIELPRQGGEGLGIPALIRLGQAAVQGIHVGHALGWA